MTPKALAASGDRIFEALTGRSPTDPAEREALARWIVEHILAAIGAITDPIDSRVAEIAFAAHPTFHGLYVSERVKQPRTETVLSSHQYWDRRQRVCTEVISVLRQANHARFPPRFRVFLAAYGTDPDWEPTHVAIGTKIAGLRAGVELLSMASRDAIVIGHSMAEHADSLADYSPQRYTVFRRMGYRRPQPIPHRFGRVDILPGTLDEVRRDILGRCDAVILIGGDAGTSYEADLADELRRPVIPVPTSGGAALRYITTGASPFPEIVSAYSDLAAADRAALPDTVARTLTAVIDTQTRRASGQAHPAAPNG